MSGRVPWASVVLLSCVVVVRCGQGGGATGVSGIGGPESVQVLSGRTDQPVPSLAGLTAVQGQPLSLQAPGFFTYHTTFGGSPILLWPADDGFLTAEHTRRLVYGGKNPGRLTRLPQGVAAVTLVPDGGIRAFPWALTRVVRAAETLSGSHPTLDFSVPDPGGAAGGFAVDIIIDFADPIFRERPDAAGAAYTYVDGDTIIRAKIVFRSLQIAGFWFSEDNFETAVIHEVFHATGLNHSSGAQDPPGIMSDSAVSYRFRAPTDHERLVMKMQYSRVAGTTLSGTVESDPGVRTQSTEPEWRVVCVIS